MDRSVEGRKGRYKFQKFIAESHAPANVTLLRGSSRSYERE